jgi:hypothetical protein
MDTVMNTTDAQPVEVGTTKLDRDTIRQAILDSKPEVNIIDVFGVKVEIKAPDLEGLLQYRGAQVDDTIMARSIVDHCYVPETEEKVFDEADVAVLMKQKMTPDMKKLIGAINKSMGGDEELPKAVTEAAFQAP